MTHKPSYEELEKIIRELEKEALMRKQAEEALRESQQMLQSVLDAIPVRVFWKNSDSNYLGCNRPFALDAGLQSPEEIVGRNDFEIARAEQADLYHSDDRLVMETGVAILGYEEHQTTQSGDKIWVRKSKIPLLDVKGEIKGVLGTYEDITVHKQAEDALQLSESRLRRAEVVALFGNWEFILGCDKAQASEGARIIYGLGGAEWSIPEVQRIPLPEYRGMLDKALSGLIEEGKPYNVEFKIRRPTDGKIIDIHSIAEYSPEKKVVFGVIQDITDRKRAEEALLESNARISHLNDVMRAIRDVGSLINREKDPIELLNAVCHSLVQTRGYVVVWIGKPEAGSKRVLMVACSGVGGDFLQHAPITWDDSPTGQGPAGTAMRERRAVVFDNLATDPRFSLWKDPVVAYGGASIASIPLIHDERLFGVLTVKADRPHAFDLNEVELLSNLAADVARALQSLENEAAHKRAEDALRESEAMYRTLVENIPQKVFMKDTDSCYVSINEHYALDLGIRPADVIGKTDYDFFPRKLANKYRADDKRIMKTGVTEELEEHYISQGKEVWVQTVKTPVRDVNGKIVGIFGIFWDITERKQAQDELFNSRQMLRSILDNIPQRVFWKDRNSVFVGCNKPFALDGGYEDPSELVGKTSYETASGAMADRYTADDRGVMESGRPKINYEQLQIRADGSQAWLITSKVPMYDQDHQVIGVLGTYSDITERKKAEEALRESEERFSTFFRTSPVGTSITRLSDGRFTDINDAFLGLFGYTREEVIGQDPLKLGMWANPEDRAKMVEILQEQGKIKDFETVFVTKSGEIRDVSVSSEVIEAAGEQYILGLTRDITKRKRAETALKASEEKYRELVQSANSIILRRDVSGKVTFFNEFAQVFFGYSEDEILGNNVVGTIVPEFESTGRNLSAMIEDIGVNPDRYKNNVNENMLHNGERVWVSWTNKPVFGENGRIREILCIGNDITERKRGEEERKKLEEQLFQAQKMESVGRLAGGVAHDFNNMLGVIIGRAEMALQQDVSNGKLQHHIEEILKAGLRSADLTRQLLAFARKQTAIPRVLDLNDTISGMLNMLRRLIGEDIDLSWQPGLDLWKVKIDPSQVDQILANLAVNARDAISGVGAVTIRAKNVVIDDSNNVAAPELIPGEYVLLTVSDNGAGMSQEVLEKIFEPFFTTKEVGKGTGLGLSTVYGIVKQNDGFIYVESKLGKGTTFKIYLQRFEPEAAQFPSEHAAIKRPTGTETILLVEDDEGVLDLGKMILEELGYTVLAAHTHVHAMHLVKEHPGDIHLLLTDVVMPEMNGRELAEKFSAIRPNLKRLYMSGYTAEVVAHRGILDEGVNFIQKPFRGDELATKVRQVLDHLE